MPANPDLAAFIRGHFPSIWTLELLLFLKNNPLKSWEGGELVHAMRASEAIVSKSIEVLLAGGLLVVENDGGVRYAAASDNLRQFVDETQELYARKPDAVRRLIVSSASAGLSAFADSFRLRRD